MVGLRQPTFAKREGVKPLPTQLQLKNVSNEIRAKIWETIHASIQKSKYKSSKDFNHYAYHWGIILRDAWFKLDHLYVDQFDGRINAISTFAKGKMSKEYAEFLEFIEFIVQHSECPKGLLAKVNSIFEEAGCAYRIIENAIVPISGPEMANAVERALSDLSGFEGARGHLLGASRQLSQGAFADSVRESIHAVESVALKIAPASSTLGPALGEIEKSFGLHPALKRGFSSLYGYTSDEEGVRHALVEGREAKVTEADALYMLGSCASFVSYLVSNSRKSASGISSINAGLILDNP